MKKYIIPILLLGAFVFDACWEDCHYPEPQYDEHAVVSNASGTDFTIKCSIGEVPLPAGSTSYALESLLLENGAFKDYCLPRLGDTVWFLFDENKSLIHTRVQSGDGMMFSPSNNNILNPDSWGKVDRHVNGAPRNGDGLFFDHIFTMTDTDASPDMKRQTAGER